MSIVERESELVTGIGKATIEAGAVKMSLRGMTMTRHAPPRSTGSCTQLELKRCEIQSIWRMSTTEIPRRLQEHRSAQERSNYEDEAKSAKKVVTSGRERQHVMPYFRKRQAGGSWLHSTSIIVLSLAFFSSVTRVVISVNIWRT